MKKILLIFCTIIILLSLTGCMMTTKYHITESPVLQEDEHDGIEVQCLYLDKEAIKTRHGLKNNPFLPPPMLATPKYMIIFELKIKNLEEAPVKIDIRDIHLYYKDKRYSAVSKNQMEMKIDDFTEKGTDKAIQKRIAKNYMLGDIRTIEGLSETKKYLVFMSGFKDRGDAELILPFKSIDDLEAGEFMFYYDFKLK